jgi:hypothetical protein
MLYREIDIGDELAQARECSQEPVGPCLRIGIQQPDPADPLHRIEPLGNSFVIALTYGKKVDWYENVMIKGRCSLHWKHKDYNLVNPRFIEPEAALAAFLRRLRPTLRKKVEYFLKLEIQQDTGNSTR